MSARRIAAIVLPDLACAIAREEGRVRPPFGVIVRSDAAEDAALGGEAREGDAILAAVDPIAWSRGARPGQRVAEAAAFVGPLAVATVAESALSMALERVAEVALALGTTAAIELEQGDGHTRPPAYAPADLRGAGPRHTVWLDVTGCARLVGGEDVLCSDLVARVGELDLGARVAIADGPRIAQAVACWSGGRDRVVVPTGEAESARALGELPIVALPLEPALVGWLGKLGLLRVGDLARIDRARLAHRLGTRAADLLELIAGRDPAPLRAWSPPRRIVETAVFEDPVDTAEPLLFVLRGLVARAAIRLQARGEACRRIALLLRGRHALGAPGEQASHESERIELALPLALASEDDIGTALRARVERLSLGAPIVAVELALEELGARGATQLALDQSRRAHPEAWPLLLAELDARLGTGRVGMLELRALHPPEARSALVPIRPPHTSGRRRQATGAVAETSHDAAAPSRLLPLAVAVPRLEPGALVAVDRSIFVVDALDLEERLDGIDWWTASPLSRDYARVVLRGPAHEPRPPRGEARALHAEALVFVDRTTGHTFLHGWMD
jgi:protein ImuB